MPLYLSSVDVIKMFFSFVLNICKCGWSFKNIHSFAVERNRKPFRIDENSVSLYFHVLILPTRCNSSDANGNALDMNDVTNSLLLAPSSPNPTNINAATIPSAARSVYNSTTMPMNGNAIDSYSPILSETSSILTDSTVDHQHHHPQGDGLGLPNARTRWAPQQQRQLFQAHAHAQSFVNSQGKTETDIF